jgi:hypothetical protein
MITSQGFGLIAELIAAALVIAALTSFGGPNLGWSASRWRL